MMRLLELPETTRGAAMLGKISMGHARALLGAPDPDILCAKIVSEQLSVRETEALVKALTGKDASDKKPFLEEPKA